MKWTLRKDKRFSLYRVERSREVEKERSREGVRISRAEGIAKVNFLKQVAPWTLRCYTTPSISSTEGQRKKHEWKCTLNLSFLIFLNSVHLNNYVFIHYRRKHILLKHHWYHSTGSNYSTRTLVYIMIRMKASDLQTTYSVLRNNLIFNIILQWNVVAAVIYAKRNKVNFRRSFT
jgi:hypothetical protein